MTQNTIIHADPQHDSPVTLRFRGWMERGACTKNIPTDIFFDKWGSHTAKMYCTSCVVRQDCLDYAITNEITDGVWGGLTAQERQRLDKR